MRRFFAVVLTLAFASIASAAERYALVLQDAPAAKAMGSSTERDSPAVRSARESIRARQATLRLALEGRGFTVTGATDTLLNAVYVIAEAKDLPVLQQMPGVKYVARMRRVEPKLNAAVNLVDAPAAWNLAGGIPNAGAGIKIGIIDTGIDQTHPGFKDSTLAIPSGYPKCDIQANCAFTNNKVIVARSYVKAPYTSYGSGAANTVPDDSSPRDRVGHGTAVAMTAAGNTNTGPLATITGLAPHAYLGNYKIFGTPGINDGASEQAILQALDDAFTDGMNIVNLSLGGPATGVPSQDPEAQAIETAVGQNMVVVTAAGNEGSNSVNGPPSLATVGSPGFAVDAIAVAATGNSHQVVQSVHTAGPNVPSNLTTIAALQDDSVFVTSTFTAPLLDAAKSGSGDGCTAYSGSPFTNSIALIQRGTCTFVVKLENAEAAGAVGVVLYNNGQTPDLISPSVFANGTQNIPSFFIGTNDGIALKAYVDANTGVSVTLDATLSGFSAASDSNQVTSFSSRGPALGGALKPDVAAPGENIYMAAETYDPNGALYDPSGYTIAAGTSFSSPIVSGIAGLVRQAHPTFTALQVKSAIVNTATADTSDTFTNKTPSGVLSVGGGKAEALHAVQSNVTSEPSTISFGILAGTVSATQQLKITNFSSASLTLAIAATRTVADAATQLTLSAPSLTVAAGQSGTVTVSLAGSKPAPGVYEGAITITGGAVPLSVPYVYLVGDGVPADFLSIAGDQETGIVGQTVPDGFSAFQIVDKYGVPVANVPLTWTATDGGSIIKPDAVTDSDGQGFAQTVLGSAAGTYHFVVNVGTFTSYTFAVDARVQPAISPSGIVNAASFAVGSGAAPGSIVSIFGTGLSDFVDGATYIPLPISIDSVEVGFDAGALSLPGPLFYVSSPQLNVQVPWELQGQTSAQVKVNIEPNLGQLYTLPLVNYSPALFVAGNIAAAQDASSNAITSANAAVRGKVITLYGTGLGPVTNQPATGAPASSTTPSLTTTQPTVTIGGQPAVVQFSGLAPGFAGLNQINVTVPANSGTGIQPVTLSIGGVSAPVVNIPVQ